MSEPTIATERTDEEVMCRELIVTLAGEERTITIKAIKEAKEYRRVLGRLIRKLIVPLINLKEHDLEKIDHAELAGMAFETILVDGIDAFPELLAAYAPECKAEIERASDEEQVDAMVEVLEVTFPLVVSVGKAAFKMMSASGMFGEMMRTAKSPSPSAQP